MAPIEIPRTKFQQRLLTPVSIDITGLDKLQTGVDNIDKQVAGLSISVSTNLKEQLNPLKEQFTKFQPEILTSITEKISPILETVNALHNNVNAFPQTLKENVSDKIVLVQGQLDQQIFPLLKEIFKAVNSSNDEDEIDLGNLDIGCVESAFVFLRLLNQVEDLIIDQKFSEPRKSNSKLLEGYKNNKPYSNCQQILTQKVESGQLSEAEKNELVRMFEALFNPIHSSLTERAERWLKLEAFRQQTIHFFFSEKCQDYLPAPDQNSEGTEPNSEGETPPDSSPVAS